MAEDGSTARRVRVERNIYRRPSGVYEVGLKDGGGKQRWSTVSGGNTAARALRDELLARRGRGERVVTDGRLRVAEAAAKWLDGPVQNLRLRTQECYRNAIDQHLLPAFGTRRLDAISPDDLALLVRELRSRGFPESTIVIVLGIANRMYRYSARRLGWTGANPVSLMLPSERPKPSHGKRRRIFESRELEQTIRAAGEPHRTLFTWTTVMTPSSSSATRSTATATDRRRRRTDRLAPCPSQESWRSRSRSTTDRIALLAVERLCVLHIHRVPARAAERDASPSCGAAEGERRERNPTFPLLHQQDDQGRPVPVEHGELPSTHGFRHTRRQRHPGGVCPRARRHASPQHAPVADARGVRRPAEAVAPGWPRPTVAASPEGEMRLYRATWAEHDPARVDSFRSHDELQRPPRGPEIRAAVIHMAVSMFETAEPCWALIDRTNGRIGDHVAELRLVPGFGVCTAKTGGPLHWSVWRDPAVLHAAISGYTDRWTLPILSVDDERTRSSTAQAIWSTRR